MIDVQKGPLGALEKDALPFTDSIVEHLSRLSHVRLHDARIGQVLIADLIHRIGLKPIYLLEDRVLLSKGVLNLETEYLLIKKVLHANPTTCDLVLIARADATLRGADLVVAKALLLGAIKNLVIRHDDVRVARNLKAIARDSLCFKKSHLLNKNTWVNHDAVADHWDRPFIHDP